MFLVRAVLRAIAAAGILASAGPAHAGAVGADRTDAARQAPSVQAQDMASRILQSGDHQGLPFGIVDKRGSKVFLYSPQGRLGGATPVLLGMARGDHSVPGVGDLPPARIPPAHRTTPAGRFVTEPGRNLDGEDVVWFDYDAGLAIHRLRADAARQTRQQRLESGVPDATRVSAGCIVVPVAFYENVVHPLLGQGRGVIYVLPETREARDLFAAVGAAPSLLPL